MKILKVNTIQLAHDFIKNYASVSEDSILIDATMGRGNDTLFLCENFSGDVTAFDVQQEALDSTKERLESNGKNARLILDSHSNMDKYFEADTVSIIVFNLGYLPKADHHVATNKVTTIEAIEKGLRLLKKGGIISLCIYQGGDTGFEEKDAVMDYLKLLDMRDYTVVVSELYNKQNYPPIFAGIIKEK